MAFFPMALLPMAFFQGSLWHFYLWHFYLWHFFLWHFFLQSSLATSSDRFSYDMVTAAHAVFHGSRNDNWWYFTYFFSPKIDCLCSLEPPQWGDSNEHHQPAFLSKNEKNNVYPCNPHFSLYKVGVSRDCSLLGLVSMMRKKLNQMLKTTMLWRPTTRYVFQWNRRLCLL